MWRYGDEGEGLVAIIGNMKPAPSDWAIPTGYMNDIRKEALVMMFGEDTIKLSDEYVDLHRVISQNKIHETKSAENTKIIMRVKEIKAELKKRGYFR